VLPAFSGTSSVRVLAVNPGAAPARIELRALTVEGERAMAPITVAGLRVAVVVLGSRPGVYGIEAISRTPIVIALTSVDGTKAVQAFAATGVQLRPAGGAAVSLDPRLGVPAPGSPG
jgi:hypothetical protein